MLSRCRSILLPYARMESLLIYPCTVAAETWPAYTLDEPQNFVFEQNITSHPEADWYRAEGIYYIGELIEARNGGNCSDLVACSADD